MKPASLGRLLLIATLAAGIGYAALHREALDAAHLQRFLSEAGFAAPLVFMAVYAAATVLFVPGSVLTLLGGALFGPVLGTFYSLTGATLGAALALVVARYLASDWVRHKAGGRLAQLIEGIDAEGWRFVAFVRLVPLFPFNLVNYAFGLTRIPLSHYVLTSYLCMLPGAFAYTYLGFAGREAIAGGEGAIRNGLIALAVLAAVSFLPRLVKHLKGPAMTDIHDLKRRQDSHQEFVVLDLRDRADFDGAGGHIAGARSVPLPELASRLAELDADRERTIFMVCRTQKRSLQAARLLRDKGFARVTVVKGGMEAWARAGFPVEGRAQAPATLSGEAARA